MKIKTIKRKNRRLFLKGLISILTALPQLSLAQYVPFAFIKKKTTTNEDFSGVIGGAPMGTLPIGGDQ